MTVEPGAEISAVSPLIYGQFLEHFHRIVYGGISSPGRRSRMRTAFARTCSRPFASSASILRWPGGCFASAYHWRDGVGAPRESIYDKAWRVEEPDAFGTNEFLGFCAAAGTAPASLATRERARPRR